MNIEINLVNTILSIVYAGVFIYCLGGLMYHLGRKHEIRRCMSALNGFSTALSKDIDKVLAKMKNK